MNMLYKKKQVKKLVAKMNNYIYIYINHTYMIETALHVQKQVFCNKQFFIYI